MFPNNINSSPSATQNGDVKTSIFYFNDLHGNRIGAEKLYTASRIYDANLKARPDVDSFKLCGGDSSIGSKVGKCNFFTQFLNMIKIDASAIGNHEMDSMSANFSKTIDSIKYKYIATNLNMDKGSEFNSDATAGRLVKSQIVTKNGHQYGLVGTMPPELRKLLNMEANKGTADISVDDFNQSITEIQQEIDKLKAQGINKIIAVSHWGDEKDRTLAAKTKGLDVIIGGHTHVLLEGVKPGVNYVSSADGEPVMITQAGKEGKYSGVLDLVFDAKGIIKQVSNNVQSTKNTMKSLVVNYFEDKYMGKPTPIATLTKPAESSVEEKTLEYLESPIASFVADAIRKKSGAQLSFSNVAGVKGGLPKGTITDRDVDEISPYNNPVKLHKLTEKDVIDALNGGIAAALDVSHRPGLLQVSGMKYTLTKDNKLKEVSITNPDGSLTNIDPANPSATKTYTVAYNTYLAGGPGKLKMLNCPEKVLQTFESGDAEALKEHFKSFNGKPVDISAEGRITREQ